MNKLMGCLVVCAALACAPAIAGDDAFALKPDQKMGAVLKDLSGKRVTVHLRSGGDLTGKLTVVGDHLVQLSQLANKDFFDAVVALDAIAAVEVKARSQ
jgi:hypothetical protein